MLTISHNGQVGSVPLNSGNNGQEIVEDLSRLVAGMTHGTGKILGLRQANNVWPIQLVAASPSTFQEGVYEVVMSRDSDDEEEGDSSVSRSISTRRTFTLPCNDDDGDDDGEDNVATIFYREEDLDEANLLVTQTGLCGLDPHDVYDAVLIATENDGAMTLRQYTTYVASLLEETTEKTDAPKLRRMLHKLFYALDTGGTGLVQSDDLTSILVVLCRGGSLHKLRFLFEVFSTPGVDGLTRRQFWRYTRALLTCLVHLSTIGSSMRSSESRSMLNTAAIQITSRVFAEGGRGGNGRVSYEEWEATYDSGAKGFEWTKFVDGDTWCRSDDGGGQGASVDSPRTAWTSTRVSMRIALPSSRSSSTTLEITQGDVALLRLVSNETILARSTPDLVHGMLESVRTTEGHVHRDDFEACLSHLVGKQGPNPLVQSTLSGIFDSFDRLQSDVVDYDELASGECVDSFFLSFSSNFFQLFFISFFLPSSTLTNCLLSSLFLSLSLSPPSLSLSLSLSLYLINNNKRSLPSLWWWKE